MYNHCNTEKRKQMDRIEIHVGKHDDGYSCTEEIFVSLLQWLHSEYQFIFRDCWMFEYQKNVNISKRLVFDPHIGTNLEYAKQYYGIELIKKNIINNFVDEVIKLIHRGYVVPLEINGFWCHWLVQYNRKNVEHAIILNGYNEEKEEFECIDPYYEKEDIKIPLGEVVNGSICYYCYCLVNLSLRSYKLQDEISNLCENYIKRDSLTNLKRFQTEVTNSFEEFCNQLSGNYTDSVFYQSIDKYRRSRKKFFYFVKYLKKDNECDFMDVLLEKSDELRRRWNNLQKYLLKIFISNTMIDGKQHVINYINSIVENEGKILLFMMKYVGKDI